MQDSTPLTSKHIKVAIILSVLLVALLGLQAVRLFHAHCGGELVGSSTSPDGTSEVGIYEVAHPLSWGTREVYALRLDLRRDGRKIATGTFDIVCDGPAWWEMMLFVTWNDDGALVEGLGIGEPQAVFASFDGSVSAINRDGSTVLLQGS